MNSALGVFCGLSWIGGLVVAMGLGCSEPPSARLLSDLRHEDPSVRKKATEELGFAPNPAREVVFALAEGVASDDAELRRLSAIALGELGAAAVPAISVLRRALQDGDRSVRIAAALAILNIDAEQEAPRGVILAEIRDANPKVVRAIGELGPSADWAIPALRHLRSHHHKPVRLLSGQSLKQIDRSSK